MTTTSSTRSRSLPLVVVHVLIVMQKMKLFLATVVVATLAAMGYRLLRNHETKKADQVVDAFFTDYKTSDDLAIQKHLAQITQDHGQVQGILERQRDAIRNYSSMSLTPTLNILLNNAEVPVSWHLMIRMKKLAEGWKITSLDEFITRKQ
jgi:hypothetical protein